MIKRINEHIEFHEAIDSHRSDVAFLNEVKRYIVDMQATHHSQRHEIERLECKLAIKHQPTPNLEL